MAILLLDIDRFRFINDTFGHRVADDLLAAFGRRLSTCVSADHVVARIAGDQFAILLPGIASVNDVTHLARSVRHQVGPSGSRTPPWRSWSVSWLPWSMAAS